MATQQAAAESSLGPRISNAGFRSCFCICSFPCLGCSCPRSLLGSFFLILLVPTQMPPPLVISSAGPPPHPQSLHRLPRFVCRVRWSAAAIVLCAC